MITQQRSQYDNNDLGKGQRSDIKHLTESRLHSEFCRRTFSCAILQTTSPLPMTSKKPQQHIFLRVTPRSIKSQRHNTYPIDVLKVYIKKSIIGHYHTNNRIMMFDLSPKIKADMRQEFREEICQQTTIFAAMFQRKLSIPMQPFLILCN